MPRIYPAFLVALGASSCPWAESGKIGLPELATALEGVTCSASREELALLQLHARQREAGAEPSSSRKDGKLAEDEGLVTVQDSNFSGVDDGWAESRCQQIGPDEGFHQCGCFHDDANTVRPNENPAVYKGWAMWKPEPSATVFNKVQQQHLLRDAGVSGMIPGIAYNPAILPLHHDRSISSLAASWHPDAHYLVVARHYLLGRQGREQCQDKTEGDEFAWTSSDYSSIMLLNKNLKTLVVGKLPLPVEDYRLFAYQGKVLVTANSVNRSVEDNKTRIWSYRVFELGLNMTRHHHNPLQQCPRLLKVELTEFKYNGVSDFDHKNSQFRFHGKNIGLVHNNKDGELKLLWRLSNPVSVMQWTSETLYTDRGSRQLRNNGNPIYLPEHDAYLAFGHTFWEGAAMHRNDQGHKWHNVRNYIHRVVLFDAKPPYRWLRASKPLCLPAISGMSKGLDLPVRDEWCEGIQFIMSWFLEGDDIVMTYGVGDCDPAIARLPLAVLLKATSTNFTQHPEADLLDTAVDDNNGQWRFNRD